MEREARLLAAAMLAAGFGSENLTTMTPDSIATRAVALTNAIVGKVEEDEKIRNTIANEAYLAKLAADRELGNRQKASQDRAAARKPAQSGDAPDSGDSDPPPAAESTDTQEQMEPNTDG